MQISFIRDDGKTFETGRGWLVLEGSIKGLDAPAVTIYSEPRGTGTGSINLGRQLLAKDVELELHCYSSPLESRREAMQFFNPIHSFTICVTANFSTLTSPAHLSFCDFPTMRHMAAARLQFVREQIGWNAGEVTQAFDNEVEAFSYPMVYTQDAPNHSVKINTFESAQDLIVNDGDYSAAFKLKCNIITPVLESSWLKNMLDNTDERPHEIILQITVNGEVFNIGYRHEWTSKEPVELYVEVDGCNDCSNLTPWSQTAPISALLLRPGDNNVKIEAFASAWIQPEVQVPENQNRPTKKRKAAKCSGSISFTKQRMCCI